MNRAPITTHILDLHLGKPGQGVSVELSSKQSQERVLTGTTDKDGRIEYWDQNFSLNEGIWTLVFQTQDWFQKQHRSSFFENIVINFKVEVSQVHYHIPLLLSEYGYSTYRGS